MAADLEKDHALTATKHDQRVATRRETVYDVQLHGRHGILRGMTRDISRTGALVGINDPAFAEVHTEPGGAGTRIASLFGEGLHLRFREAPFSVQAEVVRLMEGSPGQGWTISVGVRFLRQLTPAECALLAIDDPASRDETPAEEEDDEDGSFQALDPALVKEEDEDSVQLTQSGPRLGLHDILELVVARNATDLHIKAGSPVRIRVDGELENLGDRCLTATDARALIHELATQDQLWQFARKGDLDAARSFDGLGRFRINIFVCSGVMGAAIRRIPEQIRSIEELGLALACRELADKKRGLVLVTGPTGCGKSTTLAAMVDHVNRTRACHIVTMEDPIEYRHKEIRAHITQREIGRDTVDFASALRRALRQDPDVILVGEMRDLETVALAVTAAETGHLVFGTLHTTSAVQTVARIVDVFPSTQQPQIRMQLADSLRGVISQVLVPKIGGGVAVAQEVLIATDGVRGLVREGKTPQIENMMQTGAQHGMVTLDTSLDRLVEDGVIEYENAVALARRPARIRMPLPAPATQD